MTTEIKLHESEKSPITLMEQEKRSIIICPMAGSFPPNGMNIPLVAGPGRDNNSEINILEEQLKAFEPISLVEMDRVKLMNRIDTKFIVGYHQLPEILAKASSAYRILEINSSRVAPYSSIYFDTTDVQMYTMHHNGKLNRYKVRMRLYLQSGDTYLEIKRKNNKGRTSKKRISISREHFESLDLDEVERVFIRDKSPYELENLKPQLQNIFHRITLVDYNDTERVTLDVELNFRKIGANAYVPMDRIVIVEIKQDGAASSSFRKLLDEASVPPKSISKYCLGMMLTNPGLKYNRFKEKIRLINKIAT